MMTLEDAIRRERLSDELRELQFTNMTKLPEETHEDSLRRRAAVRLRMDEILSELAW